MRVKRDRMPWVRFAGFAIDTGGLDMILQPDEIATVLSTLGLLLALIYAVAYIAEHSNSLRHQVRNLRPARHAKVEWTKNK